MFIYLSKKISIPNDILLNCIAWNNPFHWLACGGEQALLKALKLETDGSSSNPILHTSNTTFTPLPQIQSNLSISQSLEGHSGSILHLCWNTHYGKLTTADSNGMVIVWIQHKGLWYEEMVNDRSKCGVAAMQWDRTGKKIAIIYMDGNIIIGGVEGNRIQAKDLGCGFTHLTWSPDSNFILLATTEGPLRLYDSQCNYLHRITTFAGEQTKVVSIDWYNGHSSENVPCLAIAFDNGKLQLSKNERDPGPILIDTNLRNMTIAWNPNGTVLAVGGLQVTRSSSDPEETKCYVLIQFYTHQGTYLRYLKVPGTHLSQLAWEASGLKLALAVDSILYFCNVHLDYKFASLPSTICYTYSKLNDMEDTLVFYNHETNTKLEKPSPHLQLLFSNQLHLAFTTTKPNSPTLVSIVNSLGTPLDTRSLYWFRPTSGCMTPTYVILTDGQWIAFFPYQITGTASALSALLWQKESQIKLFHIDTEILSVLNETSPSSSSSSSCSDPIVHLTCTQDFIVFARSSNTIWKYHFPGFTKQASFTFPVRPHRLYVNCNGDTVAVTDLAGGLRFLRLTSMAQTLLSMDFKDVWAVTWSEDDPELVALMEKSRMLVMKGKELESPVPVRGYLASFSDLLIHLIDLDRLMLQPESPDPPHVLRLYTTSYRETQSLMTQVSLHDAFQFIEHDHPHPKLYRLIQDAALEQLDLSLAHQCMIKLRNYGGLLLIKKLSKITEKSKQKALVFTYLGHLEQSERLYLDMDRRDLALEMHTMLCNWFRIVQMGQAWGANDAGIEQCWKAIGEEYMRQRKWTQAITYLTQARQFDSLADAYFFSNHTLALEKLASSLPSTNPVLDRIGDHFAALGMCAEAVTAYTKRGLIEKAVHVCIHLHQWHRALELVKDKKGIDQLFHQFANQFKSKGDTFALIMLYKEAQLSLKAAQLLFELGKQVSKSTVFSPLVLKKIYVLAALEVDRHHQSFSGSLLPFAYDPQNVSNEKGVDASMLETPWKMAEAYHFYLLSQRQYHAGDLEAALRTSIALKTYEDILSTQRVHSTIALFSFLSENFQMCSKSLSRLQKDSKSESENETYERIGIEIFRNHSYSEYSNKVLHPCSNCTNYLNDCESHCKQCGTQFPICIASGRIIFDFQTFVCPQCKHKALESEIALWTCCPLCHFELSNP